MVVVSRFVNRKNQLVEWFLTIVHVLKTNVTSLKIAVENISYTHGLNIVNLHEQNYDGSSNMRGAFNGLKILIFEKINLHIIFIFLYINCNWHYLQLHIIIWSSRYFFIH